MKIYIIISLLLIPLFVTSQNNISGIVLENNTSNNEIVLPGASVYWMDSSEGVVTDFDGKFSISNTGNYNSLIISYVGYKTDTY